MIRLIVVLSIFLSLAGQAAAAECAARAQYGPGGEGLFYKWHRVPAVVVLARPGDPDIQVVRDAMAYWNARFAEIGSGFRLGEVAVVPMSPGDDRYAAEIGDSVLHRARLAPWPPPDGMADHCGKIVVVLSTHDFISGVRPILRLGLILAAIKGTDHYPLHLPNVARNVIAHELGHAIGLKHNSDSTKLMCGRPASCRPMDFQSATARIYDLTDDEKRRLLAAYPADWRDAP